MSKRRQKPAKASPTPPPADAEQNGVLHNQVLDFELKLTMDGELEGWLNRRHLTPEHIKAFGLGRASKRSTTIPDRLAIPIHNADGKLVAYCGRYVGDDEPEDEPKYKLPPGFRKDLEFFNIHRAWALREGHPHFLVMESYLSVMRHHEHAPCVSPMGHELSGRQLDLLRGLPLANWEQWPRAFVIADGDDPGREGAARIAGKLASVFWRCIIHLPNGAKPHHLSSGELSPRLQKAWHGSRQKIAGARAPTPKTPPERGWYGSF